MPTSSEGVHFYRLQKKAPIIGESQCILSIHGFLLKGKLYLFISEKDIIRNTNNTASKSINSRVSFLFHYYNKVARKEKAGMR